MFYIAMFYISLSYLKYSSIDVYLNGQCPSLDLVISSDIPRCDEALQHES